MYWKVIKWWYICYKVVFYSGIVEYKAIFSQNIIDPGDTSSTIRRSDDYYFLRQKSKIINLKVGMKSHLTGKSFWMLTEWFEVHRFEEKGHRKWRFVFQREEFIIYSTVACFNIYVCNHFWNILVCNDALNLVIFFSFKKTKIHITNECLKIIQANYEKKYWV